VGLVSTPEKVSVAYRGESRGEGPDDRTRWDHPAWEQHRWPIHVCPHFVLLLAQKNFPLHRADLNLGIGSHANREFAGVGRLEPVWEEGRLRQRVLQLQQT